MSIERTNADGQAQKTRCPFEWETTSPRNDGDGCPVERTRCIREPGHPGRHLDPLGRRPPEPAVELVQGVVFVLLRDGHVLMERCPKKAARHGGEWFLPGGRIEATDHGPAHAMVRELQEELGVGPAQSVALPLVDATGGNNPGSFLMRPYLITAWHGTIPPHCLDCPDVPLRWVPLAEALASPVRAVRCILAGLPPELADGLNNVLPPESAAEQLDAVYGDMGLMAKHEAEDTARRLREAGMRTFVVAWEDGWFCAVPAADRAKAEARLRVMNF